MPKNTFSGGTDFPIKSIAGASMATAHPGKSVVKSYSGFLFDFRLNLKIFLLLCLISGIVHPAAAQPAAVKTDSVTVYGDIETFSKKNSFTRFVYRLVFRPVASIPARKMSHKISPISYAGLEGKIIREINIVTLDPFGFSLKDAAILPQNILFKAGNALHIRTQDITVKNILFIRKNEPFDSLLVKESERLIRSQYYVREVLFSFVTAGKAADSVDINIRASDKWSIYLNGAVSPARATAGFTEKNFIGSGHELQNDYAWNRPNDRKAVTVNYFIPNVRNTHVSAALHYNIDEYGNFAKNLTVERPFYSPFAQWAAGMNISQLFQKNFSAPPGQNIKYNTQDYWAGKAGRIFKGKAENERTTKAIVAGRYLRIRYLEKPYEIPDSWHHYSSEDFYLAGLGISMRKYFRDNYIYNYGSIEDVPVGTVYGMTGGYQIRENTGRLYLGSRITYGNYNGRGYLSTSFEYGTFIRGRSLEQGVFAGGVNYFSNLLEIGHWRIRQFIKPQVTWGLHRFPFDSLTINNENGIRGFSSSDRGTQKIVLTIQTQSYAPWNLAGFRFGPYLTGSLGMLGNATSGFKHSRVSSQLGIGTLIKNEYLVLNNFQLSVAYYPSIPGNGYNIFKFNAFRTTDFGFSDFIFGKPEPAPFQ